MVKHEAVVVKQEVDDLDLRKKKRPKRTQKDVQVDILRYRELLRNGQDLECDIPPRRLKKENEDEEEFKYEPYVDPIVQVTRSKTKGKVAPTMKRPQYKPTITRIPTVNSMKLKDKDTLPLPPKKHLLHNFEDHVMMDMLYGEAVNVINNTISRKTSDDTIDVALHHGFLTKNLAHEGRRFDLGSDYFHPNSQCLHPSFFYSNDIDAFFDALNGGQEDKRTEVRANVPLV